MALGAILSLRGGTPVFIPPVKRGCSLFCCRCSRAPGALCPCEQPRGRRQQGVVPGDRRDPGWPHLRRRCGVVHQCVPGPELGGVPGPHCPARVRKLVVRAAALRMCSSFFFFFLRGKPVRSKSRGKERVCCLLPFPVPLLSTREKHGCVSQLPCLMQSCRCGFSSE
jgi:hypothetical protein